MHKNLLAIAAVLFSVAALSATLSRADAYPAGASVSYGANPVVSAGGTVSGGTQTVLTAPSDQMIVVTDLLLSMHSTSCGSLLTLASSSGATLASAKLHSYFDEIDVDGSYHIVRAALTNSQPSMVQHAFSSGLPLPAGTSLEITESGDCSVAYTVSGYYARP